MHIAILKPIYSNETFVFDTEIDESKLPIIANFPVGSTKMHFGYTRKLQVAVLSVRRLSFSVSHGERDDSEDNL